MHVSDKWPRAWQHHSRIRAMKVNIKIGWSCTMFRNKTHKPFLQSQALNVHNVFFFTNRQIRERVSEVLTFYAPFILLDAIAVSLNLPLRQDLDKHTGVFGESNRFYVFMFVVTRLPRVALYEEPVNRKLGLFATLSGFIASVSRSAYHWCLQSN